MTHEQIRRVESILADNGFREERLIRILQEVQKEEERAFLPRSILQYISHRMDVPLSRIYSIAGFYESLSLQPKGRTRIQVCRGTACHLEKSDLIFELFKRKLDIGEGNTTPDLAYSVETVNCPGCCWTAALVIVNDVDYYERVSLADVRSIIERYEEVKIEDRTPRGSTCEAGRPVSIL
jgi:NADH-quinone oxidoreductase subunit E